MKLSKGLKRMIIVSLWLILTIGIIISDEQKDVLGAIAMSSVFCLLIWFGVLHSSTPREKQLLEGEGDLLAESKRGKNNPVIENSSAIPFFVIVDVETTGLIKHDGRPGKKIINEKPDSFPRIVQIAWVLMSERYEVAEKKSYYIKQSSPIPEDAIEIHGITDELCRLEGRELEDVLNEFYNDIQYCSAIVGHNVMFDKQVIEAEFIRCSLPKPFTNMKKFDTMIMGQELMGRYRFPLTDLAVKMLGQKQVRELENNFHDAEGDAWLTANLFAWLHKHDYNGMRGRSFEKDDVGGGCLGCGGTSTIILIVTMIVVLFN